jgi:HSP20 family protein
MFPRRFVDFPEWNVWEPFGQLERLRREMERVSNLSAAGTPYFASAGVFPLTNVSEDKDKYYVRAELPGMTADQIEITATENNLSIAGERSIPREADNVRYHRRERESGKFSRMLGLPGSIDPDKVEASFKNGVLTVVLPKSEASKPKQITVK